MQRRATDPADYDPTAARHADPVLEALERRLDEHESATAARMDALAAKVDCIHADVTARMDAVLARLDQLAGSVGTLEREKRDAEVRADERRAVLAEVREGTLPGQLATPAEARGIDRLSAWVTGWTWWQVLLLAAVLVGGPTVAGPAIDRVLDAFLPSTAQEARTRADPPPSEPGTAGGVSTQSAAQP